MLKKLIKDCLTEKDGETYDVVRVLGCFAFFSFHLFALVHVITTPHSLNFIEIATGISMLLGVIGAGVGYKDGKQNQLSSSSGSSGIGNQ